jgi:dihydropyrimidinase
MVRDDELAACMERARDLEALTMVHAENGDIIDLLVQRALARGDTSAIYHALTRPEFVEAEATGRAARIAEHVGAPLFVVHVTCGAAAAEIEAAQQRGAPVTGETCVQYLINSIDDLRRPGVEGCRYICSPPLRDKANHELLWGYVRRGVLESVSTDHCPFNDEQKSRGLDNFSLVPNGLAQIQHRLAKLWDEGVVMGRITRSQLVDRTSTTIARRFGLQAKGALAPGKDADVVVLDPAAPHPYGKATSFMNVDYDLYEGETASASVRHTFSRGTLVYDRGEIKTEPGHGRFVPRTLGRARQAVA